MAYVQPKFSTGLSLSHHSTLSLHRCFRHLFCAMQSPACTVRGLPADLTGQVTYETSQGIEGGHAHIGRGIWTDSSGCTYPVWSLLLGYRLDSYSIAPLQIAIKVVMVRNNVTGKVTSADCRKLCKVSRLNIMINGEV